MHMLVCIYANSSARALMQEPLEESAHMSLCTSPHMAQINIKGIILPLLQSTDSAPRMALRAERTSLMVFTHTSNATLRTQSCLGMSQSCPVFLHCGHPSLLFRISNPGPLHILGQHSSTELCPQLKYVLQF